MHVGGRLENRNIFEGSHATYEMAFCLCVNIHHIVCMLSISHQLGQEQQQMLKCSVCVQVFSVVIAQDKDNSGQSFNGSGGLYVPMHTPSNISCQPEKARHTPSWVTFLLHTAQAGYHMFSDRTRVKVHRSMK